MSNSPQSPTFVREHTPHVQPDSPQRTAIPGMIRSISNSAVLPVSFLERDENQPRKVFDADALTQLAESIKTHGQLQPILVKRKPDCDDRFIIVAGERRWRACQQVEVGSIKALILERDLTEFELLCLQYAENNDRENLNPVDKGLMFQQMTKLQKCSARELARQMNVDVATITNHMKILDLPEDIKEHVITGRIGLVAAVYLLRIADATERAEYVEGLLNQTLSANDVKKNTKTTKDEAGNKKAQQIKSKQWRRGGVNISVSSSRRVTYVEWAERLRAIAEELEKDGRTKRAA